VGYVYISVGKRVSQAACLLALGFCSLCVERVVTERFRVVGNWKALTPALSQRERGKVFSP